MKMKILFKNADRFFITIFIILLTSISSISAADKSMKKLQVYTVNYPLAYFAQKIAKDHADVFFPVTAGEDPAYWMPDAQIISKYQKADLIMLNGAGYAKWTAKVSLPRSKMVDTSKTFKDRYIYTKAAVTHSHGPEGKHAHENLAFTTWLDFSNAIEQARTVKKALIRKNSGLSDLFNQNFITLEKELLELDNRLKEIVSKNINLPLIVSHPVYDYMIHRYTMNIKSVHWEPNEKPTPNQWDELKNILKDHPAKYMVWEGVPDSGNVSALNVLGIKSIVVSPCATQPEKFDFMDVMKQNIENIKIIYDW
jgi:zinc transport system substrate-binding protein